MDFALTPHAHAGRRSGPTLARQRGLEPRTFGLEIRCSIHLSYWRLRRTAASDWARRVAVLLGVRTGADHIRPDHYIT